MKRLFTSSWLRGGGALFFVLILGIIFNASGAFFHWNTHRDMLRQVSVYGILATGMTLVIVTGGIDLAVGSVLGLVAVVFSLLTLHHGFPAWQAIPLCLLLGAGCGAFSGTWMAKFKIQPFVVTLAMMVSARGLAKFISQGQKISTSIQNADGSFTNIELPPIFETLDHKCFGGNVAVVTLIFFACIFLAWIFLSKIKYGRYFYAIGGSEQASFLSGVPVGRIRIMAYALCGLLSAVAGICQAAQEQQGDPEAGLGYELTAIAIVVIGGTNLNGGRGSIILTLLGTLTMGYLEKILSINAVGEPTRLILTGGIILSAVLLQQWGASARLDA